MRIEWDNICNSYGFEICHRHNFKKPNGRGCFNENFQTQLDSLLLEVFLMILIYLLLSTIQSWSDISFVGLKSLVPSGFLVFRYQVMTF